MEDQLAANAAKSVSPSEASTRIPDYKRTSLSSRNSNEKKGAGDDDSTIATTGDSNKPTTPSKLHRRKFSLGNGLLSYSRKQPPAQPSSPQTSQKEKLSLSTNVPANNDSLLIPQTPAPANFVRRTNSYDQSSESMTFDEPNGGSDMLVSSRLEQENRVHRYSSSGGGAGAAASGNAAAGTGAQGAAGQGGKAAGHSGAKKTPLKFEIHIVKVPLVGLYGVQFKKVSGNTWLYKSLASEILNRLNL
ncbi:unnamed protein product [Ambrosiozyma monospora]|uniref:Unnamed protein product n=1 Tax=Ambrosiozyma monospora TaxID=43982 RepID=A0ACB5T5Y5_AMBMO|nr:unnamed protein product [Ambrosiozyma monospora]